MNPDPNNKDIFNADGTPKITSNPNFSFSTPSSNPNFTFANSATPAKTAQTGFTVTVPDTIPSSAFNPNVAPSDVYTARDTVSQQGADATAQTNQDAQNTINQTVAPFSDPSKTINDVLYGDPSTIETDYQAALQRYADQAAKIDEQLSLAQSNAASDTGVLDLQKKLNDTNVKIANKEAALRRRLRAFNEDAQVRGYSRDFVQAEKAKIEADANAELADLYIIQNAQQGNVDSARQYIKTAVDNKYKSIESEITARQAELKAQESKLEGERLKENQRLQIALDERKRNLDQEKSDAATKRELLISIAQDGASTAEQERLMTAPTIDQAYTLAANLMAKKFRSSSTASGFKAPTIKEINGKDYQWNDQLGIWEEVSIAGGGSDVSNTTANIGFLRDTTARILGTGKYDGDGLYKGAGQSTIAQAAGRLFRGQTKTSRLEAQVDTLRANMLTLATDPSIKEFFGPQMSDADVKLMTAAGTTLRPQAQTPDELKDEALRIDDLLNRMETAVQQGAQARQNMVTAPDGTLVIITD